MTLITGWRLEPLLTVRQSDDGRLVEWTGESLSPAARCLTLSPCTTAPGVGCVCGYRIVTDRDSLVGYWRETNAAGGFTGRLLVRAEGCGVVRDGVTDIDGQVDPADTFRVERYRVVGRSAWSLVDKVLVSGVRVRGIGGWSFLRDMWL